MKIKDVNNEDGRHYVRTWVKALRIMLGWNKSQTLKWANKWKNGLNNTEGLFYHETPVWYLCNLLLPESLKKDLSSTERVLLRQTLVGVIEKNDSFCDRNPGFDWRLAKRRMEAFIGTIERKKVTSKKGIEGFLIKYQKRVLVKGPTKRQRELLRKTYVTKK